MASRGQYKALPKTSKGRVDKERLEAEWLESEAMTLLQFAKEKEYDRGALESIISFNKWRAKKAAKLVETADIEAENTAIKVRSDLIFNQLKAIQQTPASLFGVHRIYQYMVKKYENQAAQEIADVKTGKSAMTGYVSPLQLKPSEVDSLAKAGKSIVEALQKALYIEPGMPSSAMMLIQNVHQIAQRENDVESSQNQVEIIGRGVVDPRTLAAELHALFDKPQAPRAQEIDDVFTGQPEALDVELVPDGDET